MIYLAAYLLPGFLIGMRCSKAVYKGWSKYGGEMDAVETAGGVFFSMLALAFCLLIWPLVFLGYLFKRFWLQQEPK